MEPFCLQVLTLLCESVQRVAISYSNRHRALNDSPSGGDFQGNCRGIITAGAFGGALSGTLDAQLGDNPPGLQWVIDPWERLPEATNVGILAVVRASGE